MVFTTVAQLERLEVSPNTPDAVSEAFAVYRRAGGPKGFPEWHRTERDIPPHAPCNFCHD